MKIIVQKFGGTSVATAQGREAAMRRIIAAKEEGYAPVVVVSAMGRRGEPYATDTLLDLVKAIDPVIEPREMDLLVSCGEVISTVVMAHSLKAIGHPAVAMTGAQAGINTDGNHGSAQILEMNPSTILTHTGEGRIVVVAGFQGVSADGYITTLGRGGSDTTATALGVALKAEVVEIYTDVDGVMTTDPRLVPQAAILDEVTYDEICEMAHQGAKVIHPRAVEFAMTEKIPIKIKNTFSDAAGTLVADNVPERTITGLAHLTDVAQVGVEIEGESVQPAKVKVLKALAEAKISIDLINVAPNAIYFTVKDEQAKRARKLVEEMGFKVFVNSKCAKLSVIGAGMAGVPGVVAKVIETLDNAGIRILQTSDSEITIAFLIREEDLTKAVNLLHDTIGLGKM